MNNTELFEKRFGDAGTVYLDFAAKRKTTAFGRNQGSFNCTLQLIPR